VTSELISNIDTKKFLPIIRNNSTKKTPMFLGPRIYIDFTTDSDYPARLEDLLRELHGSPATAKPPVGPNPFSRTVPPGPADSRIATPTGITLSGTPLLDEAWFANNGQAANTGLSGLNFKASLELRVGLHSPVNESQIELLNAVRKSQIRTFGWPIGVLLENREQYKPRPVGDGIRAEIAVPEMELTSHPSYDYWAIRRTGDFFLLQSLFEDDRQPNSIFF
jgi:hypothetical protein